MAPNKEDTVVPPGDCKASGGMVDPAAPFVKEVIEPIATIFVACGTQIGKWHFASQRSHGFPEFRIKRTSPGGSSSMDFRKSLINLIHLRAAGNIEAN